MLTPIYFYKTDSLTNLKANSLIALKTTGDAAFSLFITDKNGLPYPLKDEGGTGGEIPTLQQVITAGNTSATRGIDIFSNIEEEGSIRGRTDEFIGVQGEATTGIGVNGMSEDGTGVIGNSFAGYGVRAYSETGTPLLAEIYDPSNTNPIARFLKDGINKVIISHDGKITATAGTASSDVVVKSQLDAVADSIGIIDPTIIEDSPNAVAGGAVFDALTGTANKIVKFIGAGEIGDSQIFDNGTNVGIGTNTPYGKLVIKDGTNRNLYIKTDATTSGTNGMSIVSLNDDTSSYIPLILQGSKVILGIDGNVGIGTNSPTYDLSIERTTEPIISLYRTGASNNYQWKTDGHKSTIGNGVIDNITLSEGGGVIIGTEGNVNAVTIKPKTPINTIYANEYGNVGIGNIPDVAMSVTGTTQSNGGNTISNIAPFHTIYALGDSQTYAGFFELELESLIGGNWRVKNKGINGDTSTQMLSRLNYEVIQMVDAEYIIVWGGINDILGDVPSATIKTNLQTIYNNSKKAGLKVITINLTPFGNYSLWTSARQIVVDEINSWIANTATNIDYRIDANTLLKDPATPLNLLPAYNLDNLHVNEEGHIVLAEYIDTFVGTWNPNPNTNTLNVIGNTFIEQLEDKTSTISLNSNSNLLGRWNAWEISANNSIDSYSFNIGNAGGNKYLHILGTESGANAGNVGIGTIPYAKFIVNDGVNRNLAILSDENQFTSLGMALVSYKDDYSDNFPLSIIASELNLSSDSVYIRNPTTSASTYDILTRNTSTGVVEKVPSSSLLAVLVTEKSTSFTLTDADVGVPFIITSSCTVTIPNGLMAGFNATFVTLAGVTLTVALGGSVVLHNNTGTTLAEKSSFTLQARTATNNYITAGAL